MSVAILDHRRNPIGISGTGGTTRAGVGHKYRDCDLDDSYAEPFFGNPHQFNNQTAPTEWNDAGREELFAKILNLATTRSRNFRVFVTGQSLDKNGNVLSTVTKVYQVFVKPNRAADGTIQSQQVVIKYEGSM